MNVQTISIDRNALRIPREIAALLAALQLREPDTASLDKLDNTEWNSLLNFCDLAHLTLPLAQLPDSGFPSWVVEKLKTNVADNALRFERVKATYKEAADVLDRAGVDHIVIKGFTQAPDYIEDPHFRAQSDIDLYCPANRIEPARIALQSIGYKPYEETDNSRADHIPAMVRLGDWQWRGNLFDPEMPLSIELHFCLWNGVASLFQISGVNAFWDRRTTRVIDGLSFQCLSSVDHLGFLALHILRNILGRDWVIHHVRELAMFLHSHAHDDAFWKAWSETHDPSLRKCEAIAFYHARAWFGCDLHEQAEIEIANLPAVQQSWLRRFEGSSLENMFYPNKDSYWLHLTFITSPIAKLTLFKRLLMPNLISSIDSPVVRFNNRRPLGSNSSQRYRQYVTYLIYRSASFSYLSVSTILRGLRWRLSQHQLLRQFWIFFLLPLFF